MPLDAGQRAQFATDGVIRLQRQTSQAAARAARDAVLAELTRLGYRHGGKWHTKRLDGTLPFQVAGKLSQALTPGPPVADLVTPELIAELSLLASGRLLPTHPHMQLLVTPPQRQEWGIPTLGWHVDLKATKPNEVPGIQVFVLLDDVLPRGGGTMAIKGSHLNRDLEPTAAQVVEMCGQAGDVFLMDMRVQHAPSLNSTTQARMMATARFVRA